MEETPPASPSEDLIQTYTKRIQIMQAVINQLRAAAQERQRWEEDAKRARIELEVAKIRIADLEDELDRGSEAPGSTVEQPDGVDANEIQHQKSIQEADNKSSGLDGTKECPTDRLADQQGQGHSCGDVIHLHHVAWGSGSIRDESLGRRLLDCAARNSSFTATREFIGCDVRPGERSTLVVAYSVPPEGPMRWLVVDEGHEGRFDI